MPPKKRLRSTSSLSGDRQQNGGESMHQDESFQALHDPEPSQTSIDDVDLVIEENSGSEGVDTHTSDGSEDLESYDNSEHVGGTVPPVGQHFASEQEDVAMIDEPASDGSTPWLDYLHNTDNPYSPDLPFGLQLAHTASLSTMATHHNASDEESGGASLNEELSADDSSQGYWEVQHVGDFNFSSPDQYTPFQADGPVHHLPAHSDQDATASSNILPPLLPFGVLAAPTTTTADPETLPELAEALAVAHAAVPPPLQDFNLPPLMPSSTNYMILGSENVGLVDFLRQWAHNQPSRIPVPDIRQVHLQGRREIDEVNYDELCGEYYDIQGLDWAAMGIPRAAARTQRRKVYKNYVNKADSDKWTEARPERWAVNSENYFRFRKTVVRPDVNLAHFQLRSVLSTPSQVQAFYPTSKGINRLNPLTLETELALDLGEFSALNRVITTMDAACGVLVAGTFGGDYLIKSYVHDSSQSEGSITNPQMGITNHLQVHSQRGCGTPVASIASNDHGFRVLDLETEQYVSDLMYHFVMNCSAVSPDRRLRVVVGDSRDVVILNVETGETEVELPGHKDYGFSCDWSDDGFTVATGFQDKSVKIWDARKWTNANRHPTPVSVWCDMAGARNLKFSPIGSGPQVLVSAEEADYINILDAKRGDPNIVTDFYDPHAFRRKQTIDLFGEIGGISFGDEGHELNVLVGDPHRGGLVQFERASVGSCKPTMIESVPIF